MKLKTAIVRLERLGWDVVTSDIWLEATKDGHTRLSGHIQYGKVLSWRVTGNDPDRVEFDEFNSTHTSSLSRAVGLSRH